MKEDIKANVKEHYGKIASQVTSSSKSSCCSSKSCCDEISENSKLYKGEDLSNLPIEAINASLGCANPIVFAELKKGEIVLDLGSGGGIDVLIASKYVGNTGKIYGIDMTDEMLKLANANKEKMGIKNVEFIKGYIEDIPLKDNTIDVIISNCVINLSENKYNVISEAYRVLKPGGRIAIADIVLLKDIPDKIKGNRDLWCGCVAGSLSIDEYERILKNAGFTDISIEPIHIYTKSIIQNEILNSNPDVLNSISDLDSLDGAFAGAQIKAKK